MTKKQRHQFYKKLLKNICEDPNTSYGLCLYVFKTVTIDVRFGRHLCDFPELCSKRPKRMYKYGVYWFPCTTKGWEKRIALVEQCIEETK